MKEVSERVTSACARCTRSVTGVLRCAARARSCRPAAGCTAPHALQNGGGLAPPLPAGLPQVSSYIQGCINTALQAATAAPRGMQNHARGQAPPRSQRVRATRESQLRGGSGRGMIRVRGGRWEHAGGGALHAHDLLHLTRGVVVVVGRGCCAHQKFEIVCRSIRQLSTRQSSRGRPVQGLIALFRPSK